MISGPRNLSTAIMYSFDNRKDTMGVDEPFYAHYLNSNPYVNHPGRKEIINSQSINPNEIIEDLYTKAESCTYLFVKDMAHHLVDINLDWMEEVKNIFLIRDPKKLINSFSKVIQNPSIKDIGLKDEFELYQYLKTKGKNPIVVDSGDLLNNPKGILNKICDALQIPFSDEMLNWNAGARLIDGIWAPYWYSNVHQSTGFSPQKTSVEMMSKKHKPLLDEALPFYQSLYKEAIK